MNWENDSDEGHHLGLIDEQNDDEGTGDDAVKFDSQDEDECEDLFAGVWSPQLAKKRKMRRMRFQSRGRVGSVYADAGSTSRAKSEDTYV